MFERLHQCLTRIRETKPLVLNITNYVTMDFMANSLLALGAAPIMSEEEHELMELVAIASSVNINIGTLDTGFLQKARMAIKQAKNQAKPIILDPVGAGATKIRTQAALEFLPHAAIVRGNASEIMAMYSASNKPLGVEALHTPEQALDAGKYLNTAYRLVVAISGATDIVICQKYTKSLSFGSALMPYVTGMGCTLTAVIAAFHAVEKDPFEAAMLATAYFGLCGEQAVQTTAAPGSFRAAFIDSLYAPDLAMMQNRLA